MKQKMLNVLDIVCPAVLVLCLMVTSLQYSLSHWYPELLPNSWWTALLFAVLAGYWVAQLLSRLARWWVYRHYVGKSFIYRCPGHEDGGLCPEDGEQCMIFPLREEPSDYLVIAKNKTLFLAQFPDGHESITHIHNLSKT